MAAQYRFKQIKLIAADELRRYLGGASVALCYFALAFPQYATLLLRSALVRRCIADACSQVAVAGT